MALWLVHDSSVFVFDYGLMSVTCMTCSSPSSSAKRERHRTPPSTAANHLLQQLQQGVQLIYFAVCACPYPPKFWFPFVVTAPIRRFSKPGQASGKSHFAIAEIAMLTAVLSFGSGSASPWGN